MFINASDTLDTVHLDKNAIFSSAHFQVTFSRFQTLSQNIICNKSKVRFPKFVLTEIIATVDSPFKIKVQFLIGLFYSTTNFRNLSIREIYKKLTEIVRVEIFRNFRVSERFWENSKIGKIPKRFWNQGEGRIAIKWHRKTCTTLFLMRISISVDYILVDVLKLGFNFFY